MTTAAEQLRHERAFYARHELGMTDEQAERFADSELSLSERDIEQIELHLEDAVDRLESVHQELAKVHEQLLAAKLKLIGDRLSGR